MNHQQNYAPVMRQDQVIAFIVTMILITKFLCRWSVCAVKLYLARLRLYGKVVFHAPTRKVLWRMRRQYRQMNNALDQPVGANYLPGSYVALNYQEGTLSRAEADTLAVLQAALEETKEGNHDH